MEVTLIKSIFRNPSNYFNKDIKISGWVKTIRDSKTFGFIEVNDGSFFKNIQIVFDDSLENFNEICKLTISSSIEITGTLIETQNAKQAFELRAKDIKIVSISDSA